MIIHRTCCKAFFAILVFTCSAAEARAADSAAPKGKPNVLFIIADDLNCALGCCGNDVVKTPNVDRLAASGVRFERAYCNYPVCNPSRTSFLSGRYPETTGVLLQQTNPRAHLGQDFQFMPEYFRAQGYFTAGIGKVAHGSFADTIQWDVYAEPARGANHGEVTDTPRRPRGNRRAQPKRDRTDSDEPDVPFPWRATGNVDEEEPDGKLAAQVVELLERPKDKPFFIVAGFHKPHIPHTAPQEYFDMYPPETIPLPEEPAGHEKNIPPIARGKYLPDLTDLQRREIISHYYAATTFMDAQVGKVLEAMDRLKLWDNTIVIFVGDHGWHLGEHGGMWAKPSLMQEAAAAPLIVVAPGKQSKAVSPRLVEFVDIYPTLTELCGLATPPGLEGVSLAPLLDDPQQPWKKFVLTVVSARGGGLGRAARTEAHTYIEWPDGSEQLYDCTRDPKEFENLAEKPRYSSTIAELKQLLKAHESAAQSPEKVPRRKRRAS
ncbi:MAG: sulfatase [Pirellulales bacterium]